MEKLRTSQQLDQIGIEQLNRLLEGYKAKSFNIYRAVLSSFFSWALKQGYVGENPVNQIPVKPIKRGVPEVYTIDQAKRLLRASRDLHGGALLPYMALGFFAGIRPEEIQKLRWEDINLEDGEARIADHVAKTGRRRVVTLSPNCLEWLRLCWGKDIHPNAFRDKLQEVRMMAGLSVDKFKDDRLRKKFNISKDVELDQWIHDGIRHTAISHHIRAHKNENETALWAGNSRQIIHNHYLSLVSSKETEIFWSITPDNIDADNILNMEVSA
jgi:integrase